MRPGNREEHAPIEWKTPVIKGALGIPLLMLLLLLLAIAYERGVIGQGREELLTRSAMLLTSIVCASICAGKARNRKLISGLLGQTALLVLVLFLGVLTRGSACFNISLLTAILVLISGGFLGSVLSVGRRNTPPFRRRR